MYEPVEPGAGMSEALGSTGTGIHGQAALPGQVVETGSLVVTAENVREVIDLGGYTHSLFQPDSATEEPDKREESRSGTQSPDLFGPPLPGQGVLLLAGGLVEQAGVLDQALALVEFKTVRFKSMVFPGSSVRVQIQYLTHEPRSNHRAAAEYLWVVLDEQNTIIVEAIAVMLMSQEWKA